MGRPKSEPTVVVTIRLPEDVVAEIRRRASRNGRSVGAYLRMKLTEYARGK